MVCSSGAAIEHIDVAQSHDLLLVAPATPIRSPNRAGSADDFLSTLYLAFRGPVILAPSMNTNMLGNERDASQHGNAAPTRPRHPWNR